MRCPHYREDIGGCGVWRHRSATCSTWYCKYDRGAVGMAFWDPLRDLLKAAEEALARWCLLELELDADALDGLTPERGEKPSPSAPDLDGAADPTRYGAVWGQWHGREE